jgi:hypothetical protein
MFPKQKKKRYSKYRRFLGHQTNKKKKKNFHKVYYIKMLNKLNKEKLLKNAREKQ